MFVKFVNAQTSGGWNVVDTDFTEYDVYNSWESFFRVYEKRGLNVAANIALAIKWVDENYNGYDLAVLANQSNPLYPKYEDEIKKYLMLM